MEIEVKKLLGLARIVSCEKIEWDDDRQCYFRVDASPDGTSLAGAEWNPLMFNGDTFELAMDASMYFWCDRMIDSSIAGDNYSEEEVPHAGCRGYDETRLAIVRNAAKRGEFRLMPD